MARVMVLAVSLCVVARGVAAQPASLIDIVRESPVRAALENMRAAEAQVLAEQVRICEVPAPPFDEAARGDVLRRAFVDAGLRNVRVDRAGNVLGERAGRTARPHLVVASHLDTVFPAETDVKVKREGAVFRGPGISDNCRGLAVLVAIARALQQAGVETPGPITFVANVGEEGLGDLRGVKELFGETLKGRIDRFLSIDGSGRDAGTPHITHVAVGSLRYRITFKGPGGHSFGDFGLPNPAGALGRAIAKIQELQVSSSPRATFNIGRIGGGTSVNAIPFEAWMEVDMRSSDASALAALDTRFHQALAQAATEENRRWGRPGTITISKDLVGDRPAGSLPATAPIVRTAQAAAEALGLGSSLAEGSTDANLPISLNVPAITIGGGGVGSQAHSLNETYDSRDAWKGAQHALLLTIALSHP
jgi:acetylornithine deacetylase/succinyl-diaminopimelate desuccinylase-like protein